MKKLFKKSQLILLGVVCYVFLTGTASSLEIPKFASSSESQQWSDPQPLKIVTEVTSDGITIYHYYLSDADFEKINGTLSKTRHLGEPDCIAGSGNCAIISTTERIIYHPA
jgi:hypothetical protein